MIHSLMIGSRVHADKRGITFCHFNDKTGDLVYVGGFGGIEMPTFQCFDAEKSILYSVSETETDGHVLAFSVSSSLSASLVWSASSKGGAPCHLALDGKKGIAVSNYADGVFTYLGLPGPSFSKKFTGVGFDPIRQKNSHIHSSLIPPNPDYVFVADLGLDRILWYEDAFQQLKHIDVPPGTGPRHMAYHNTMLYVASELSNEVLVIQLEPEARIVQTISTLPSDFHAESTVADIHLSVDSRFLYCSNRGHDSIAVFSLDRKTSLLSLSCHCPVGKEPRDFTLSPSDRFVLVGNAGDDVVTVHRRDETDGSLSEPIHSMVVDQPVCLTFLD